MSSPAPTESQSPERKHAAGTWRSKALRGLSRVALLIALIFGGFLVVVYFLLNRMIFPGTSTQGADFAQAKPRAGVEKVLLKNEQGERIVGFYGAALTADGKPRPNAADRPALIYFYGNAMCLAYCDFELDRFRRLGLNVLILDYLGFGMSEGSASEVGCRETAEAGFDYLRSRGFAAKHIIAGGWSLGGAVAIDLASRRQLGGLFAFSTFTSTREMGRSIFPIPLPHWYFTDRFESLHKISRVNCPILLGHGGRDSMIPFSMFEELRAATDPPASTIVIDQADHNDFYEVGGKTLFDAIGQFVERVAAE